MPPMPQLPKPHKITVSGAPVQDNVFGTRAVERIQLTTEFEDKEVQARIEYLAERGYNLVTVINERVVKEYIPLSSPEQATNRLGGSDGTLYATLYFGKAPLVKAKAPKA